ncbi:MAG: CDP-diacylglycerol diphosphatase [Xanthobacteraceae bacterium]
MVTLANQAARWTAAASVILIGVLCHIPAAHSANPNALWNIVHGQCVPDEQQHGEPKPCADVDLTSGTARGFAILKDIRGTSQFLLIPTRRMSGIESRSLLEPRAVNYFADAWTARTFTEAALGKKMPRDVLSLAINSEYGRTQNQLHIHIECIRNDVRETLRRERDHIGPRWTLLTRPLAGHRYRALRIMGITLAGHDPFDLLARGIPGARAAMGHYTLVVVGMRFRGKSGFVVLEHRADLVRGDTGSGEELQDHACALARP